VGRLTFNPREPGAANNPPGEFTMTDRKKKPDRPNADDNLARAHRAEAEANEMRADYQAAVDTLEHILACDPGCAHGIAQGFLATINGRALA
jgi:hypothetical protein